MQVTAAPPRIHPLSLQLANQIAAGEVVERPASVVKELLENAVDAGARRVDIEVEEGGVKLIRISDDGCGIHRDDLALALAPHATSKIHSSRDLGAISSLGFRGEALASIASVSRLTLSSRSTDSEQGWSLVLGDEAQPAAQPHGTRIEVRDLFYNTPARRKFLRAERTEFSHLEETVRRQALACFDRAFSLRHNGRSVFTLPAGSAERRVAALMGKSFLRDALLVDESAAGMRLWGWFAPPQSARAQSDRQYFFLNGRTIRDRLVGHALRQAYGEALPAGRHAAYVLYLELDPARVDVNVHPTKHEVRFRDTRMVHDFLHRALARQLERGEAAEVSVVERVASIAGAKAVNPSSATIAPPLVTVGGGALFPPPRQASASRIAEELLGYAALSGATEGTFGEPLTALTANYLLSRRGRDHFLIDRRAAAQAFLAHHLHQAESVRQRPLLLPLSLPVDERQAAIWQALQVPLAELGVELSPLTEGEWALRAVPALLQEGDAERLGERLRTLAIDAGREALIAVVAASASAPRASGPEALAQELKGLEGCLHDAALPASSWRLLDEAALAALLGEAS